MTKYIDVKHLIKSGDVVAYSDTDIVSQIIRFFTKSKYSHVAVVWVIDMIPMVLEATAANGVALRTLDTRDFFWISTGIRWNKTIENKAQTKLEMPYSFIDAFKVGLGLSPSKNGEICTYFVDDTLGLPRTLESPGEVVNHFVQQGKPVTFVSI